MLPSLGDLVARPSGGAPAAAATGPALPAPAPIPARVAPPPRPRTLAIRGEGVTAYDAANMFSPEGRDWNAYLASPDVEQNFFRDVIVARIRDLVRNDGWANGAISRILDGVVGGDLRLVAKPDYQALSLQSKTLDKQWADEFGRAAEALWRSYSRDPGRWCDGGRRYTVPQLFRLAYRQKLVDGEALGLPLWLPERRGFGRARYCTTLQLIDTDRLSNPHLAIDTKYRRAGVEIDDWGAPVGYHIRRAHMGDWFNAVASVTWDRIDRETEFGRPLVIHDFDSDRPGEHRGAGGLLRPVLTRMKMLSQYDSVELQAAVVNSVFAAYVESSADLASLQDALNAPPAVGWQHGGQDSPPVPGGGPYADSRLKVGDGVLPVLRPGEKLVSVDSKRPSTNYPAFENAVIRNLAAALGMTAEQLSQDWSRVNYSSARAALLEAWKTLQRRRHDFGVGFCTPFYSCFLEEAIDRGELPMPAGAPDFVEARAEYSHCRWMGPPRGWIDPVKEAQAAVLRMDAGLTTLEQECAEQGLDWEEVVEQRALERARFDKLKLPHPTWMGVDMGRDDGDASGGATDVAKKPVKPQAQ